MLENINKMIYNLEKIKGVNQMPNVSWTDEQKQAIETKGSNLLVAAAARKWKNSCTCRAYNS